MSSEYQGGVLVRLDRDDAKTLFGSQDAPSQVLHSLLERGDVTTLSLNDRWQVLARCCGTYPPGSDDGPPPFVWCFGGRTLQADDTCFLSMMRPDMVGHLATALQDVDQAWCVGRLETVGFQPNEADLADLRQTREALVPFLHETAQAGGAVVFAVDL